jgi:hypothetical protein
MNETLSSEDNPESVTHVLRQFCYLSLRLLSFEISAERSAQGRTDVATGHDRSARPEASRAEVPIGARPLNENHVNVQPIVRRSTGEADFEMVGVNVAGRRRIDGMTARVKRHDHASISARALQSGDVTAPRLGQVLEIGGFRAIVSAGVSERDAGRRGVR